MAVITSVDPRPVTPPAYEFNQKAQAKVALTRGTLVLATADVPSSGYDVVVDKVPTGSAGSLVKMWIVLKDAQAGGVVDLGSHGEMDGFSGLTAGAPLYPSGTTAGAIDTSAPTAFATTPAVTATPRIWAISTTRIYHNL